MSMISSIFQRAARKRAYVNLLHLDDHLLRDIGLSRGDVHKLMAGRTPRSRDA